MTIFIEPSTNEDKVTVHFNGNTFLVPKDKVPSIWATVMEQPFVDQVYFDIPDHTFVYAILEYLRERPF